MEVIEAGSKLQILLHNISTALCSRGLRSLQELNESCPGRTKVAMCGLACVPAVQESELFARLCILSHCEAHGEDALRSRSRCHTKWRKQLSSGAPVHAGAGRHGFAPGIARLVCSELRLVAVLARSSCGIAVVQLGQNFAYLLFAKFTEPDQTVVSSSSGSCNMLCCIVVLYCIHTF